MMSVADRILKEVAARPVGQWVCTPKDFLDLGSRARKDQLRDRWPLKGSQDRRTNGPVSPCGTERHAVIDTRYPWLDYDAMRNMILGNVPDFGWIMEQVRYAEATINGT